MASQLPVYRLESPSEGPTETTPLISRSNQAQSRNGATPSPEETSTAPDGRDNEESILMLTRRLRCLFGIITWPIVPLGTLVILALLWLLNAALFLDRPQPCSHPLHLYAFFSFILAVYTPNHTRVRGWMFSHVRDRDESTRPAHVRRYDQFVHTVALLYVYAGLTLVQTCRDDVGLTLDGGEEDPAQGGPVNSCKATCPHSYSALTVYVTTLEIFTFSLILPLLFLPCIYLWFLRQATADQEALALLQERFREEEESLMHRSSGVAASVILGQLEEVGLIQDEQDANKTWVVPANTNLEEDWSSEANDANGVKECCICMTDFCVRLATVDLEAPVEEDQVVVRTPACHHLFHKGCISTWVRGRQQDPGRRDEGRARRTTCPLCRQDLRPSAT